MSRAVSIKQILAGIMNLLIDLFIFSSVHSTAFLDSFHFSDISSKDICRLVLSLTVQHKRSRAQIPCEVEIQRMFDDVCCEIGVRPEKVALVWDYLAEVPKVMGIRHPRVALPVQKFTEQQLRIMVLQRESKRR